MKKKPAFLAKAAPKAVHEAIHLSFVGAAGFTLGLGSSWGGEIEAIANAGLVLSLLCCAGSFFYPERKFDFSPGEILLLFFVVAFVFLSTRLNVPSRDIQGNIYINNPIWWGCFLKMCIAAALLGTRMRGKKTALLPVAAFCFGSFSLALFFIGYTLAILGNHNATLVFNPLDACYINRAGIMSLAVFFPIFLAALMFYANLLRSRSYWIMVVCFYAVISGAGFIFESRSIFILLYALLPLQGAVLLGKGMWKNAKSTVVSLSAVVLFLVALGFLFSHLKRPVAATLFDDPRFGMLLSFPKQLILDPFLYAQVPYDYQAMTGVHYFHNFFADMHRLSGFWSFLAACTLVGFIGIRIFLLSFSCVEGRVLLFLFISVFLILNTSVVPEGEVQPILMAILLGGVAESIYREKSSIRF